MLDHFKNCNSRHSGSGSDGSSGCSLTSKSTLDSFVKCTGKS